MFVSETLVCFLLAILFISFEEDCLLSLYVKI